MNTQNNQMHKQTERRLRDALLDCMSREHEPTVSELCEAASINRSTFYRHYKDVFDLMDQTERQLQQGLIRILAEKGRQKDSSLEPMLQYIRTYNAFYRIYLRRQADAPLAAGFDRIWEESLKPRFLKAGVSDERRMRYYYQFVRAGVMQVIKIWIDDGCRESDEEIAGILRAMLVSSK